MPSLYVFFVKKVKDVDKKTLVEKIFKWFQSLLTINTSA